MINNPIVIENEGFSITVQIEKDSVQIVIDDNDRDVLSEISGVSGISIYKNDDSIRVSTEYKIRKV